MAETFIRPEAETAVDADLQPILEWVTPEVTKLDLETAQQTI